MGLIDFFHIADLRPTAVVVSFLKDPVQISP